MATAVNLKEVEARALDQSRAEMWLGRLEREADVSRAMHENFLGGLQETREQASLQTPDGCFLTRVMTELPAPRQPG